MALTIQEGTTRARLGLDASGEFRAVIRENIHFDKISGAVSSVIIA